MSNPPHGPSRPRQIDPPLPAPAPTPPPAPPLESQADLDALAVRLRHAPWIALDTEADSLHCYPQKICLIQLGIPNENALVDPLARLNLDPIWTALADRGLIIHGADYDLRMLSRSYRFVPDAVFDTMLAARFVGLREFGLGTLLERFFGIRLDKASQKANWARRPLTDRMLAYARNDTRYLEPLARLLRDRLIDLDRLEWHRQTCDQLIQDCTQAPAAAPADPWRISGINRLRPRAQAIARELWHWRESEALAANRPPFFVLSHQVLLDAAERADLGENLAALVPRHLSPSRRQSFLHALESALALPQSAWPHPIRVHGPRLTLSQRRRLGHLEQRRNRRAHELAIDPTLVASRATLVALAHDWERFAPRLLPWQCAILEDGR